MTREEINEGNKLIAEFMGKKVHLPQMIEGRKDQVYLKSPDGHTSHWPYCNLPPFHTSWDWLMPVVEKITEMKYPINIYFSHIQNTTSVYDLKEDYSVIRESDTIEKPIEITYKAVVQFIRWHNTQNT